MTDLVADTLLRALVAVLVLSAVGGLFIWRPWSRRSKPHEHPAE
jgi:hypothetical protein